jgi:hypothetical protein
MSTHKRIAVVDKVIETTASTTQTSARVKGPNKTPNSSSHIGEMEDGVGIGQPVPNLASSEQNRAPETSGASDPLATDIDPISNGITVSETLIARSASQPDADQNPNANHIPSDVVASGTSITSSGDQTEVDQDMDVDSIAGDVAAIENSTAASVNQANSDQDMEVDQIASDAATSGTLTVGSTNGVDALAIGTPNETICETPAGGNSTQPVLTVAPAITNTPVPKAAPIKYINGMSAYEWERAENIKQNKKILASMGLDNAGRQVFGKHNKENNPPSKSKRKPKKTSAEKRKLRSSGTPISDRLACVMTDIE